MEGKVSEGMWLQQPHHQSNPKRNTSFANAIFLLLSNTQRELNRDFCST
jgi:hypothetical protein